MNMVSYVLFSLWYTNGSDSYEQEVEQVEPYSGKSWVDGARLLWFGSPFGRTYTRPGVRIESSRKLSRNKYTVRTNLYDDLVRSRIYNLNRELGFINIDPRIYNIRLLSTRMKRKSLKDCVSQMTVKCGDLKPYQLLTVVF